MKKRAIVSVVNDLLTDRRVDRTCQTLVKLGFDVILVGRRLKNGITLPPRNYRMHRMRLFFVKGPLFYAELNFRLLFFILFRKANLLISNDLDTLLPNFINHRLRKIPLVYDTHEYFTGVPELIHRPGVQKIWKSIERYIFPKLKQVITVNQSIARMYNEEYGNEVHVVRNIPQQIDASRVLTKTELGVEGKHMILLQGAGINIDRGAEEAIEAMHWIDDAVLFIIGGGDVVEQLQERAKNPVLEGKVVFIPRQSAGMLKSYTQLADIGLSIDKDTNINYRYSLPNKLFDYIHAGVPVLASRLPEVEQIVTKYSIGDFIDNHNPEHIAARINRMFADPARILQWKQNLERAALDLSWETEEKVLISLFQQYA